VYILEDVRTNHVEVHSEQPSTEKLIRAKITLQSRKKWNVNMALSTSHIILVVFIRTIFYLSYIIHASTLKNDPRLAALHKSGRIPYCQCFWKYMEDRGAQILGTWMTTLGTAGA